MATEYLRGGHGIAYRAQHRAADHAEWLMAGDPPDAAPKAECGVAVIVELVGVSPRRVWQTKTMRSPPARGHERQTWPSPGAGEFTSTSSYLA